MTLTYIYHLHPQQPNAMEVITCWCWILHGSTNLQSVAQSERIFIFSFFMAIPNQKIVHHSGSSLLPKLERVKFNSHTTLLNGERKSPLSFQNVILTILYFTHCSSSLSQAFINLVWLEVLFC